MQELQAYVPWEFFGNLLPFNAEVLKGSAMVVRAFASQNGDGSIVRSREYILFGNGIATLIPVSDVLMRQGRNGFIGNFTQKTDVRGVRYWEVQAARPEPISAVWSLKVAHSPPDSDDGKSNRILCSKDGECGQYIYLKSNA